MKKRIIPMICLMLVATFFAVTSLNSIYAADETKDITFEDENMYNALKEELSDTISSSNDATKTLTMTQDNIDSVNDLWLERKNITNIKGIEEFTNLTWLDLHENQINDISVVSGLTNLTKLDLRENQISDISALNGLTNLIELDLSFNQISDISVLSALTNLIELDLSFNQISDISVLSALTNLTELDLQKNQISDISVLNGLTNLTWLSLHNNQISDISVLSALTNLTELDLFYNQISDISPLNGLTNLTCLNLGLNQISDISPLSGLTNLANLNLGSNQISDISVLSGLTNLTKLDLSFNQISDISPLSVLTNLIELDLCGNQISDISALNGLTNLTTLYWSGNQISDANILDNELKNIKYLGTGGQTLNITPDGRTVELPKIFLQAKDENSKLYTSEDYILENCTLSEDGKSVIIDDGAATASVRINNGLAVDTILKIKINLMKLEVSKSTEKLTNQNVGVTITADKALKPLDGWNLSEDKLSLTKEYEQNATESVKVTAEDGSTSTADISITNIDKDAPVIEYETKKNEDGSLDMILKANEKVREVEGWKLSDDQMTLTKTYTEPTTEEIKIYDLAGNETYGTIEIKFKDNKLEVEDVKVAEESKDNPKTGDMGLYLGLAMLTACVVLVASKKYENKVEKNKK